MCHPWPFHHPPAGVNYRGSATTGVRVPGVMHSPLVAPASVYKNKLDHTSVLQFLAEMFGDGDYSPEVKRRMDAGIKSASETLTLSQQRARWRRRSPATPILTRKRV